MWFKDSVLPIIQSFGIISGFAITIWVTLRGNTARRASNYLTLVNNPRALWTMTFERKHLLAAVSKDALAGLKPATPEERRFINMLFLHTSAAFELMAAKEAVDIQGLERDVRSLCEAPKVRTYWSESRQYFNRRFVHFVDNCIHHQ